MMRQQLTRFLIAPLWAALILGLPCAVRADDGSAILAATTTYLSTYVFAQPANPDTIEERIVGSYAVVDWTQGNAAGEMLLQNGASGWTVLRAGGGRFSPQMLGNVGISATDAAKLLQTCAPSMRVPLSVKHTSGRRIRSAIRCTL